MAAVDKSHALLSSQIAKTKNPPSYKLANLSSPSTIFHIIARDISLLHQLLLGGWMSLQDVLPSLLLSCPFPGYAWGDWWL